MSTLGTANVDGWRIGPRIARLDLLLPVGFPATIVITGDLTHLTQPRIEFLESETTAWELGPHPDGLTVTVPAAEIAGLKQGDQCRLVDRDVLVAAGQVRLSTGWVPSPGGTVHWYVPGPAGPRGVGVVSIEDADGDGVATVTYSDGTTSELFLPDSGGGVTLARVRAEIEAALSSGGAVHVGTGGPPPLIVGAKVGDVYIDTGTGALYQLASGV